MNFKDRLQSLLDEHELTQAELSRRAKISRATISLWFTGNVTEPSGKNLVKVSKALRVRPEWLATGIGTKEWGEKVGQTEYEGGNCFVVYRVHIKFFEGSREFSTESIGDNMAPILFSQEWYKKNDFNPEELFAIKVTGSAMEPGLYDGDWVVVNTADVKPRDGVAFAINDEGEAVVRRLFKVNNQWLAASDNPDKRIYRDKPITEETFVLGRIVHKQSERI
ncbi:XRE family transcriptional regulator [Mycoavidus cysteinexigens]|nr:LexA family transcriptional regulator [Mycoavidus cysteinexigens]